MFLGLFKLSVDWHYEVTWCRSQGWPPWNRARGQQPLHPLSALLPLPRGWPMRPIWSRYLAYDSDFTAKEGIYRPSNKYPGSRSRRACAAPGNRRAPRRWLRPCRHSDVLTGSGYICACTNLWMTAHFWAQRKQFKSAPPVQNAAPILFCS